MSSRAWLTPETTPGTKRCRALSFPNGYQWEALVLGAVLPLSDPANFEAFGAVSPEDTAAEFLEMILDFTAQEYCCSAEYWERVYATRTESLLRYWPLWEATGANVYDQSPYKAVASASGVTWGQGGIGDGNTAAGFGGVTDYISVYPSLAGLFSGPEGTLSFWMRVSSATWADGVSRTAAMFGVDASTNYVLIRKDPTPSNRLSFYYKANNVAQRLLAPGLTTEDWLHIVLTWSLGNDLVELFVDGARVDYASGLGTWAGSLNSTYTCVGSLSTHPWQPWAGDLAHVALWSVPLTSDEIEALSVVTI